MCHIIGYTCFKLVMDVWFLIVSVGLSRVTFDGNRQGWIESHLVALVGQHTQGIPKRHEGYCFLSASTAPKGILLMVQESLVEMIKTLHFFIHSWIWSMLNHIFQKKNLDFWWEKRQPACEFTTRWKRAVGHYGFLRVRSQQADQGERAEQLRSAGMWYVYP